MRLSWFGDFFRTIPDALEALWLFGDPSGRGDGWWGLLILLIWGVLLIALPLGIARRVHGEHEWVSATLGVVGGLSILWWVFGILPSAWIYYVDSSRELLEGAMIPGSVGITGPISIFGMTVVPEGYRLDIASNFYQVVRDLVVVIEHLVAFVLVFWAALRIQKRLPKTLMPGEVKPEAGGYK